MSQMLMLSDDLYNELAAMTRQHGLKNIEQLIQLWKSCEADLSHRQEIVREIESVRQQLFDKYGESPDSTDLIRDDRMR